MTNTIETMLAGQVDPRVYVCNYDLYSGGSGLQIDDVDRAVKMGVPIIIAGRKGDAGDALNIKRLNLGNSKTQVFIEMTDLYGGKYGRRRPEIGPSTDDQYVRIWTDRKNTLLNYLAQDPTFENARNFVLNTGEYIGSLVAREWKRSSVSKELIDVLTDDHDGNGWGNFYDQQKLLERVFTSLQKGE